MLEEINDLIKTNPESQALFKSFKADFKVEDEKLKKSTLKRAKVTALVLSGISVVSILFLVFALTVKIKSETQKANFESQIHQLEQQLEDCKEL